MLTASRVSDSPGWEDRLFAREMSPPAEALRAQKSPGANTVDRVLSNGGRPLTPAQLAHFESGFGHDFSSVRVHTDDNASASAAALSARAYTFGTHIVLGPGAPRPDSGPSQRLLAHELAHVVQQSRGGGVASRSAQAALESSADDAADRLARGESVTVAGRVDVGIARKSLFDQFSLGHYSWPLLQQALINQRPVDVMAADINALSSADRDQAIRDVTLERTAQARKRTDLIQKLNAQTDPAQQAVIKPMLTPPSDVIRRADELLDGLFVTIASGETAASLRAGTTAPTVAQKPLIDSALKPDLRKTSGGTAAPFEATLPNDPQTYLDKLRNATPLVIEAHHRQQVDGRGQVEHSDPAKVHALSELERVGHASVRETDKVFGQWKKGSPFKADTKATRGNIHDLWQDTENQLKGMTKDQKRQMARQLVFYFFQSDGKILSINTLHNADPKFSSGSAPLNDEAKDQKRVVDDSTASEAVVARLNEIDRGWDASAQSGQVNVQIFKPPDKASGPLAGPGVADRDFLWDMFQTLIHEYIHTLAHTDYNSYAESFGATSNQYNTLVEGVDSLLDEVVWSAVLPHVNDLALRNDVEGPAFAALPPMAISPASRRRYASYAQAVKLVNIVGIRNLYAAYFLGDVKKIKGG